MNRNGDGLCDAKPGVVAKVDMIDAAAPCSPFRPLACLIDMLP